VRLNVRLFVRIGGVDVNRRKGWFNR